MSGASSGDLHNIKAVDNLTKEELIRSCRLAVQAELDASNFYELIAESCDSRIAKEVFLEVSNEEKVHAGEFLRLISALDPDTVKFHREGAEEVNKHIGTQGGSGHYNDSDAIPGYVATNSDSFESKNKDTRLQSINEEIDEALKEK